MQRVLEDRHYKNFVGFQGKARCDGLRKAIQKPAQAGLCGLYRASELNRRKTGVFIEFDFFLLFFWIK
jgi:hypothetical protein